MDSALTDQEQDQKQVTIEDSQKPEPVNAPKPLVPPEESHAHDSDLDALMNDTLPLDHQNENIVTDNELDDIMNKIQNTTKKPNKQNDFANRTLPSKPYQLSFSSKSEMNVPSRKTPQTEKRKRKAEWPFEDFSDSPKKFSPVFFPKKNSKSSSPDSNQNNTKTQVYSQQNSQSNSQQNSPHDFTVQSPIRRSQQQKHVLSPSLYPSVTEDSWMNHSPNKPQKENSSSSPKSSLYMNVLDDVSPRKSSPPRTTPIFNSSALYPSSSSKKKSPISGKASKRKEKAKPTTPINTNAMSKKEMDKYSPKVWSVSPSKDPNGKPILKQKDAPVKRPWEKSPSNQGKPNPNHNDNAKENASSNADLSLNSDLTLPSEKDLSSITNKLSSPKSNKFGLTNTHELSEHLNDTSPKLSKIDEELLKIEKELEEEMEKEQNNNYANEKEIIPNEYQETNKFESKDDAEIRQILDEVIKEASEPVNSEKETELKIEPESDSDEDFELVQKSDKLIVASKSPTKVPDITKETSETEKQQIKLVRQSPTKSSSKTPSKSPARGSAKSTRQRKQNQQPIIQQKKHVQQKINNEVPPKPELVDTETETEKIESDSQNNKDEIILESNQSIRSGSPSRKSSLSRKSSKHSTSAKEPTQTKSTSVKSSPNKSSQSPRRRQHSETNETSDRKVKASPASESHRRRTLKEETKVAPITERSRNEENVNKPHVLTNKPTKNKNHKVNDEQENGSVHENSSVTPYRESLYPRKFEAKDMHNPQSNNTYKNDQRSSFNDNNNLTRTNETMTIMFDASPIKNKPSEREVNPYLRPDQIEQMQRMQIRQQEMLEKKKQKEEEERQRKERKKRMLEQSRKEFSEMSKRKHRHNDKHHDHKHSDNNKKEKHADEDIKLSDLTSSYSSQNVDKDSFDASLSSSSSSDLDRIFDDFGSEQPFDPVSDQYRKIAIRNYKADDDDDDDDNEEFENFNNLAAMKRRYDQKPSNRLKPSFITSYVLNRRNLNCSYLPKDNNNYNFNNNHNNNYQNNYQNNYNNNYNHYNNNNYNYNRADNNNIYGFKFEAFTPKYDNQFNLYGNNDGAYRPEPIGWNTKFNVNNNNYYNNNNNYNYNNFNNKYGGGGGRMFDNDTRSPRYGIFRQNKY
ncbi:hypothetical protein TRFO_03044 [Tritrichomonas foetus]|uniref:Uncharacterized protein n=1 Tax=Tritrichomonas foetus TaxID=1144522 RepID=A0A1J4KYV7_9EUKA|nr:hypothetical protein TRFO_03044 [Tritrichomonas foetus]|eukprot:OHT14765.1 hypothetical protein TRFO_03044 [Tritrichomonas foetus]